MAQYQAPAMPDGESRYQVEKETQRVALLKSLEYLYIEACYAKMSLVATLIGAAIEALRDELGGVTGATRMANAAVTVSIRNVSANRLLTDDDDLDDEDYFKG
ncbi:MAG TPA: hypothetical protein VJ487_06160 [Alphaproteobacteria bacterium]|nr:hypothetical protein [Alphaproteobacteria bacterium]